LKVKRERLDPFAAQRFVDDSNAYETLKGLSVTKLDALIELLTVECITAHMLRRTEFVARLAEELKVNIRTDWHGGLAAVALGKCAVDPGDAPFTIVKPRLVRKFVRLNASIKVARIKLLTRADGERGADHDFRWIVLARANEMEFARSPPRRSAHTIDLV
jgi:hypothetical protein